MGKNRFLRQALVIGSEKGYCMREVSNDAYQSIQDAVARANQALLTGDTMAVQIALGYAETYLDLLDLSGDVTVKAVPYNGSMRFQLSKRQGGISYVITSGGVRF